MTKSSPPEDYTLVLAPIRVGGHDVKLEIEITGAWQDETYLARSEQTPAVAAAIQRLRELVILHGRTEGGAT